MTVIQPSVTVSKTVQSIDPSTGIVTYQVVVSNAGSATAFGVTLADPIGSNQQPIANLTDSSGSATITSGNGTTTLGATFNLRAGATTTFTYTTQVTDRAQLVSSSTASVTYRSLSGATAILDSSTGGAAGSTTGARTGDTSAGAGAANSYRAAAATPGLGTVGGRVWQSRDASPSTYDSPVDTTLAGVVVTGRSSGADGILNSSDDLIQTTTTAADGTYVIGLLQNGPISITLPASGASGLPRSEVLVYDPHGSTASSPATASGTATATALTGFDFAYQFPPTVTAVTTSPASGTFAAGAVITFSVTFSEIVAVSGGVPTLTLNDGGTARYASGSGTTKLVFTTTIAAGQSAADLAVTMVALNGATIQSPNGVTATLTAAVTNPAGTLAISAPLTTVTGIIATPSVAGPLNAGRTVAFTLALSRAVTVTGNPALSLNNGGAGTYDAGNSTTTSLRFNYTVLAGQNTADLQVSALSLNGATIAVPGTFSLQGATPYAAGSTPGSVTTADVNGDGKLDIVVANERSAGTVSVLLGTGSGTFGAATSYAVGPHPGAVTTADVNGDGNADLIVTDGISSVAVLLGTGGGTFGAATTYAAGASPASVVASDVNGDGRPDLLIAYSGNASRGGVAVLLGAGGGTFGAATTYDAGQSPYSVATADVNGDGKLDLVVANSSSVAVLLGTGSGTFEAATTYAAGPRPTVVTTADVNGDGNLDLLAVGSGSLAVLLGTGGGAFGAAATYAVGSEPTSVTTADLNGDGRLDVAVADFNGTLSVLRGTGSGTFGAANTYAVGSITLSTTAADLNGDGRPDLVVTSGSDNAVAVLLNNSTAPGTFDATSPAVAAGHDTGLIVDTVAPPAPSTPDLVAASDSGTSSTDDITNLTTPTFTGTAEAGSTVTLYDTNGTTVLGSTTATGGLWSITSSALAAGSHTVTAKATDAAGNTGVASSGLAVTIDTTAPTLAITSNVATLSIGQTALITFTFSEDPGSTFTWTGTAGDIMVTGGTLGAISGTGLTRTATFTPTSGVNAGTASITVAAGTYSDAAGNNGGAGTTPSLTFDTLAPAAPSTPDLVSASDTGTSSTDDITNLTTPTFAGTAEAGSTVTLYDTNGTTVLGSALATGGSWSITSSTLTQGTHTVTARATDVAGNTGVASSGLAVTIDTTAPTLAITSNVATLSIGQTALITFTFSEDPGGTFTWDGTSGDIVVTGGTLGAISGTGLTRTATFTPTSGVNAGTASITVAAGTYTDTAGNNGGAGTTPSLTFDTLAPAAPSTPDLVAASDTGTSSTDDITNLTTPTFAGTAEAGSTVTLYDTNGTTVLGSTTATGGAWSITSSALAAGSHTVTAKATDAAGNVGVASAGLAVTIDTAPPLVASVTTDPASGTFGAGAVVTLTLTMSEIVAVSGGVPTLTLSNGGTARYASGSGTTRLVFTTTIAFGQSATDLAVTAVTPNGATIRDQAGNTADLAAAVTNPAGTLAISTPFTSVTSITATPSVPGPLNAGKTVAFTLALSQGVTVTGSPTLSLNDGGTGTFDAANSTATALRFNYTVQVGENTADLQVSSLTLNGATIAVAGALGLQGATSYAAGPTPASATAADVNGDGTLDLVVADVDGDSVAVLLGTGSGTFGAATLLPAGPAPRSVTAADVNGDGTLDLVVAGFDGSGGGVAVLLGTGGGAFGAATTYDAGPNPYSVTTADVNGDGTPDLVVANDTSPDGTVAVLLGTGGGTFGAATTYAVAPGPRSVATADVNGDGTLDLVVSGSGANGTVAVLLGTGSGTFAAATTYAAGQDAVSVTTADVNGDGTPDLVVAGGSVAVLLGMGSGTFGAATTYAAGILPQAVTTADVNGDGTLDLVAANLNGTVGVLLGTGSGTFGAASTYAAGRNPRSVTAADLNGDGRPDLVVANSSGGVSVLLNRSTAPGTFDPATAATATGYDTALVVDTAAPAAPSPPDLIAASDSGTSSTDNVTNATTPTFAGTAEAGSTVTLYDTDGTTVLGTSTATGGTWSITTSTLAAGAHTLTARATDTAGNIGAASSGLSVTVDTTAPTLALTSDSAQLRIGQTATITFTFSEDPGATFTWDGTAGDIVVSGGTLGAISGTGLTRTATFTPTPGTDGGTASLTVAAGTYTDTAGNTGGAGTTPSLTFDTLAPAAPSVPDLVAASDNGTSSTDDTTNVTTPTFTGTAEAGSTVTLYDTDGTTVLGSTTATGGTWSITSSTLAAGAHTIAATATDAAGNTGVASSGLSISIDTTAPMLAITSDAAQLRIGQTATITFTFSEDPGSTFVWDGTSGDILVTGGTLSAIAGAGLTRTATFTPTPGTNGGTASITVPAGTYTDAAGNNGRAGTTPSLTFDTAAPAAPSTPDLVAISDSGTLSTDDITNVTTPVFSGTAEAGSTVTLYDSDGTTVLGSGIASGGTWSITSSTLAAGAHTITARATDLAGNTGPASPGLALAIDTTAPTLAITSDAAQLRIGQTATITFTFSEDPGGTFAWDGTSGDIVTTGGTLGAISGTGLTRTATFTPTTNTNAGTASITVAGGTYTDPAGNTGGAGTTPSLTFDTLLPAAPSTPDLLAASDSGISSTDDITNATTPTFTGTAETGSTVTLYDTDGTTVLGTSTATGGAWSITSSTLAQGTHTVTARATDAAGNVGATSAGLAVTVDTTPPTLTITSDPAQLRLGQTATITFTFSEDPGGTFAWDGTSGDIVVSGGTLGAISGTGLTRTATFSPTAGTNGGTASITVAAGTYTDAAGNGGGAGSTPSLTFDTAAPTAPSIPDLVAASDSGTSSTDDITNVTAPTFNGTAEAGSTVRLFDTDGITVLGSTVATGGTWSITASSLSTGAHTVTATATDAAGNTGAASSGLVVTLDTAAPVLAITSDAAQLRAGQTATITFTFSEDPGATFTWDGTSGDIAVTGGTLGAIAGTGLTRTAAFTPTPGTNGGTARITVAAGTYTDTAGNGGGAGTTPSLAFDTLAPAAPSTPDLLAASDSGTSSADDITNVTTPTFAGTAEAGSAVSLYDTDGTTVLGTGVATGGTWSITSSALAAGAHTITARATDPAGNIGAPSSALSVAIDTTPPTLAITSDAAQLRLGQTATITFTFSEDPGGTFAWDGTSGDIVVSGDTLGAIAGTGLTRTAAFTPTPGTNGGTASITVAAGTYTDPAGNGGGSGATPSLAFDTLAPAGPSTPDLIAASDSGTSSADDITNDTTPTFSGTAEAGSAVTLYDTDGTTVLGTGVATGGTWSITSSPLAAGAHTITARATDAAGNTGVASAGLSVTLDTTAPTLAITSDAAQLRLGQTATITFTFSEAPGTTFAWDGTAGDIVVSGGTLGAIAGTGLTRTATFTPMPATNAGTASITVPAGTYTDTAGNNGRAGTTPSLTFDTLAPAAPSTPDLVAASDSGTFPADDISNVTTPTFAGTAEAGSTVSLYDTDGATVLGSTIATGGSWSIASSTLSAGLHTVTARATDLAGNTGPASPGLALTIDTTAPTLAITSDAAQLRIGQTASITFTFSEDPGATFTWDGTAGDIVVSGGTLGAIAGTGLTRTATFTPAPGTDAGAASITVAAGTYTDVAGNRGGAGTPPSLTFDTLAPAAPSTPDLIAASDSGISSTDDITNVTTPTFAGTAEAGSTVTLYDTDGTTVLGSTTATAGTWSITSSTLSAGPHTLTARATDPAGNTGPVSPGLAVTIDTTAPLIQAITATPAAGSFAAGQLVSFVLSTSEPVVVSGAPMLTLNDGGTASYGSGSGTAALLFRTMIAAGQDVAALAVTGLSLNGGTIRDGAGNPAVRSGAAASFPGLAVDTIAPVVTLALAADTGASATDRATSNPALTGTAEPNRIVTLRNGSTIIGQTPADATGAWSFTPTLADGPALLSASQTDAAGNTGSATLAIVLDSTAPAPTLRLANDTASRASGGTTRDATLTGTGEAGGTIVLTEGAAALGTTLVAADGTWRASPALAAGPHTVAASQSDLAGNIGVATIAFKLDQPPVITGTQAGQAVADSGTIRPFAQLALADPDPGASEAVLVTLYDASGTATDANGTLAGPGLTRVGVGSYALAPASPAAIAAALNALVFTPTAGQAAPGRSVTTRFDLAIADDQGAGAVDVSTTVIAAAVADGAHPFAALALQAADAATTVSITAQLSPSAPGSFGNLGGGTLSSDGSTYAITGTIAEVMAALAAVVFLPAPGAAVPTGVSIQITGGSGAATLTSTSPDGDTLRANLAGGMIVAGSGADTLIAGGADMRLQGGSGADVLVGNATGATTLAGGSGTAVFFAQGGPTLITGGPGHDTVSAPSGPVTVISGTGGSVIGLGTGSALVNGQGPDTIIGGAGPAVIGAAAGSLVSLGAGPATVSAAAGTTVVGGSGADTVGVRGTGVLFYAGPGPSLFIGGSGSSTVVGGAGSETVLAGAGGGVFSGGAAGNNLLVAGQQKTTLFGGGSGDVLFATGSAGDVLIAGAGNETLAGAGSSGNNVFFAGPGNTVIGLGSGSDSVFAGTGASTVVAGTGRDVLAFVQGKAGGTMAVLGFKLGTDQIALAGYAEGEIGRALATAQPTATQPGSSTITLSDNTRITFVGLADGTGRVFG